MGHISIKNLNIEYSDDFTAINDFNLEIRDDSLVAICGLSGSGKTSIALALCGLISYKGEITFDGNFPPAVNSGLRGVGYLPESLNLFERLSVKENLEYAQKLRKVGFIDYSSRFEDIIEICELTSTLNKKVKYLNERERKLTALARLFMRDNFIYIIDLQMPEFKEKLLELKAEFGASVLYLTPEFDEICKQADSRKFLRLGQTVDENNLYVLKLCDPYLNVCKATVSQGEAVSLFGTTKVQLPDGEYYIAVSREDMTEGNGAEVEKTEAAPNYPYALSVKGLSYYLYSDKQLSRLGYKNAKFFLI